MRRGYIDQLILKRGARFGCILNAISQQLYSGKKNQHAPFLQGTDGQSEGAWRAENLLPPPAFELRTLQPVTSRCIDCAIYAL